MGEELSPRTIDAYIYELDRFFSYWNNEERDFTSDDLRNYYLSLPAHSNYSKRRSLLAVKKYFDFTEKTHDTPSPFQGYRMPKMKGMQRSVKYLNQEECHALLQAVQKTATPFYKERDLIIIRVLLSTGIRVSELIGIRLRDVNTEDRFIDVTRKGGDHQSIPLSIDVAAQLETFIKHQSVTDRNEYLFRSRLKGQLKANSVYVLVSKYLSIANIQKSKAGPHLLRHTAFTSMCRNNVSLAAIKQLAGHKNIATTSIYLHATNEELEKAVSIMDF